MKIIYRCSKCEHEEEWDGDGVPHQHGIEPPLEVIPSWGPGDPVMTLTKLCKGVLVPKKGENDGEVD